MPLGKNIGLVLGLGLLCLGVTSCGGGGGDGNGNGGSTSLSGWWSIEARRSGTTDAFEPFIIVQTAEQGGSLWANGTELVRTGSTLHGADPSESDPDRTVTDLTVIDENRLEGSFTEYNSNVARPSNDIVLTRIPAPSGTFVIDAGGVADGQPVSLNSTTAYGIVENQAGETEFAIVHSDPFQEESQLVVEAEENPLTTGSKSVGSGLGDAAVGVQVADVEDAAAGGNLQITNVSGGRLAGTYTLTLNGGAISGTFDVEVLIETGP